ncbi:PIN domain-containing protein [Sphingomonas canadensis]|uniref:PIN domain-containing protein n=1 Tax=Sphingomonas canadensis TaxID=1219257 RepID=A0ABW3H036_9SPHN
MSPVTAWELSVATRKARTAGRLHLGEEPPDRWFSEAVRATAARIIPIRQKIAIEAARVVASTGHKDPGDCFLIATARAKGIPIVTRDAAMRGFAARDPDYLSVIDC